MAQFILYKDKIIISVDGISHEYYKIPNKPHEIITSNSEFKMEFTSWFNYLKLRINI